MKKGVFFGGLGGLFGSKTKKEILSFDEIEDKLIQADINYGIIEKAMDGLSANIEKKQLRHRLIMLFEHVNNDIKPIDDKPYVQLIFGVNGAGKTTTIAKLANLYKKENKSVILGAGDTFRAAAIEQLDKWAKIVSVPIVKTKQGHDASAVAYDTISSAVAKDIDIVLIDTAGRLQTQKNLNKELQKIGKVCNKAKDGSPHRKLLILDGTQGNSAVAQAKEFKDIIGIDGVIVTKLDGTAMGGSLFAISNELRLPIYYIGTGEKIDDIEIFVVEDFIDQLMEFIYEK